jgi:hypothetical protein
MDKPKTQVQALSQHFFRSFFQTSADATETPVVRALAVVATPMLMASFWIVMLAHGLRAWDAAGIHYLFVLYPFCAMGCVTAAQWEALFPDRADFLILLPMPLQRWTMFAAKLRAVLLFLGLFLLSANAFATLLIPVLAGRHIVGAMLAHGVAVMCSGACAALAVLLVEAVVLTVVPERWFGRVSPVVQTLLIALFLLLFLRMGSVTGQMQPLLRGDVGEARWFPPLWFLALYECLMGSETATPFAHVLARSALLSLPVLAVLVAAAYPMAWVKRRRVALEGMRSARLRDPRWAVLLHGTVLRDADARAVFHFVRQTLTRLSRYHVYLAIYCGIGLALAFTIALDLNTAHGVHVRLRPTWTLAVMPLLLFWLVAGLRGAFRLPAEIGARWVFRMAPLTTRRVVSVAKLLVFGLACGVVAAVVAVLAACGWQWRALGLQVVFGLMCSVLLVDMFLYFEDSVPFTRPLLPGRSSLPMTLVVYVFGAPLFVLLTVALEQDVAGHPWDMVRVVLAAAAVHGLMHWLRTLPSHPASDDAFLGENDGEVQTLGLSV